MNLFENHILSTLIFLPLMGILFLWVVPQRYSQLLKWTAFLISLLTTVIGFYLFFSFQSDASMQFLELYPWIPSYNISFFVGVDGISLLLVLLTVVLQPLIILYSSPKTQSLKAFYCLFLLLETGMLGVFLSLDIVLFYVFWEVVLIPMYFIIGLWGGAHRIYATVKFLLYTVFGSFLMLAALMAVVMIHHEATGIYTTNILHLYGTFFGTLESWLFLGFVLAFFIKVPVFPFHTWLPDAHVQAPTEGSVILAGVLLKLGVYGLVRFAIPLFPFATKGFLPLLVVLGLIGVLYGAFVAWAQKDLKKLVAYSSVSHMGYCIIGLFALNVLGVTGSIVQLVSHGLATAGLFFVVGMIYERANTKEISKLGGLAASCPRLLFFFLILTLASIGLPLTSGFVGEFLSLLGAFQEFAQPVLAHSVIARDAIAARGDLSFTIFDIFIFLLGVFGVFGVILGAVYMLGMFQKVMFGKPKFENMKDLGFKECAVLIPLVLFILLIGIYPNIITSKTNPSVDYFVKHFSNYKIPTAITISGEQRSSASLRAEHSEAWQSKQEALP
ncbi:MAG: NADH-quinone oxidoreductase subunit M [Deltaproteobacteria bacterium]|nr:NADH-quinone oxidoreductase subunit M [Deltaproteobacteria bacterium]